jgi:hypothetical protein
LPFKDNESFTNFSIDSKPFRNTGIVNLTDLNPVERSNKIRVEKVSISGVCRYHQYYRSLMIVLQNRSQTSLLLDRQSLSYCR